MRPHPFGGMVAGDELLLAYGHDGHCKGLFWPHKDAYSAHLEFCVGGLVRGGRALWGDPDRDALSLVTEHGGDLLSAHWNFTDRHSRGSEIVKVMSVVDGGIAMETVLVSLPHVLAEEPTALWFLLSPRIGSHRRFQTVFSPEGRDWMFSYSQDTWLGFIGFCESALESGGNLQTQGFDVAQAAHQGHTGLGDIVTHFVSGHAHYRNIEMGHVLGLARSQTLRFEASPHPGGNHVALYHALFVPGRTEEDVRARFESSVKDIRAQARKNAEAARRRLGEKAPRAPGHAHMGAVSRAVLKGLTDASGALMAAPEMDFDFRNCGGYGYSWPRDSAFCAMGLMAVGEWTLAARHLHFLAKVQERNGDFFQRYDARGNKAPSWGPLQADELGLVCAAYCELLSHAKDPVILRSLERGIQKLVEDFESRGSLEASFDLWEEAYGHHFYSNVCAYGALHRAKSLGVLAVPATRIDRAMKVCLDFCNDHFMREGFVRARGTSAHHHTDERTDISLLACIFPFSEFPMSSEAREDVFQACRARLSTSRGYKRYERDVYAGGHPWVLAGFWMAMAAHTLGAMDKSTHYRTAAIEIFNRTAELATPAGYFPEQIEDLTGKPAWILPLAWSHAFFLWAEKLVGTRP